MARGRKKNVSLEEQLVNITEDIEKTKATLKELEQTKAGLQKKIKEQQLVELQELMQENELTVDDVRALIEK